MTGAEETPLAGALLRRARQMADLSQRELADRAGVSRQVVERIESGETPGPRLNTLLTLLAAAGCHLELRPGPAETDDPEPRDGAGRRFPAHLDVRRVDRFGSWWGDWQLLSTLVPRAWHRAPRRRPAHTFDLSRRRRDERRRDERRRTGGPGDGTAPPGRGQGG